jgi:hypothetical protein
MKKLLLHIVYPKTATATLQENVFKKLFKLGNINYLGRDGIKSNEFEGDDFAKKLIKSGLYNTIIPSSNNFSPTLLNVISDENFLMLKSINEIQYNSKSDWRHMFNVVSNLLEDFKIELLVTLCKQSGLIPPPLHRPNLFRYRCSYMLKNLILHIKTLFTLKMPLI